MILVFIYSSKLLISVLLMIAMSFPEMIPGLAIGRDAAFFVFIGVGIVFGVALCWLRTTR
jgi:uncharacterized protein (DUF2062 family)